MKKYIFLIFLFFVNISFVFADDFSSFSDYLDSNVFVTSVLSVSELAVEHEYYTIEYNPNSVAGVLVGEPVFEDHVNLIGGRYRRKLNVNDYVKVPPLSNIVISALVKNESGHDVMLRDWFVFVSRGDRVLGDLKRFGAEGTFGLMYFRFWAKNIYREGNFVYKPLPVNVADGEEKFFPLYSFKTSQFLDITSYEWGPHILENGDLVVDFSVSVKSIAAFKINSIEFSHRDFYDKRDFHSNAEHTYAYQINYGKEYSAGLNSLDSFSIANPNTRVECPVRSSTKLDDNFTGDSRSLIYHRSDLGMPEDWFGRTVDLDWYLGTNSMCITLLPYTLRAKDIEYIHPFDFNVKFLETDAELGLGDELVLEVEVLNSGLPVETLKVDVHYNSEFQKIKRFDCNGEIFEDTFSWNILLLNSGEQRICNIVFEVSEKERFLILENILKIDGEIYGEKVFKYFPDLEISFVYEDEFLLNSSYGQEEIVVYGDESRGFFCKKYSYLGLEDEICI